MSGRAFGERDGFTRQAFGQGDELDLEPLLPMLTDAWATDYANDVRIDFDTPFFERMCSTPEWIAVAVFGPNGRPVGFEIGIERTLHLGKAVLSAYYVTAFSVAPAYRRRGIGRWVLEGINELVFTERGADLIFSTFHIGHAGSPTVQSTFDAISDFAVCQFSTSPLYGLRFDRWTPPSSTRAVGGRLMLDEHRLQCLTEDSARVLDAGGLRRTAASAHGASFALDRSFDAFYLSSTQDNAGSIWYAFGDDRWCWITYSFLSLAFNHTPLGACGQLQTVASHDVDDSELESALCDVAHRFAEHGCISMILLDQGAVPVDVLLRIGLRPTDTDICFAARGPAAVVQPFADAQRPYLLDFV